MKIYIDGKYFDEKSAKISVFDHGLLYGDGIFEGIRAYHGRVFRLKEHIDRLFYSAKAILLNIPRSHAEMMQAVVETYPSRSLFRRHVSTTACIISAWERGMLSRIALAE